ncbi:MAG: lactonase family protein [Bacteroidales bacterium]|nr:lactonase family protein [Bacteroidales bacterium]
MKKISLFIKTSLWALSTMALFNCAGTTEPAETIRFYVGSSNGSLSHSIYLCELNPADGAFAVLDSFAGATGASYLDLSPGEKYLFAINQDYWNQETKHATVTSFIIEPGTIALKPVNSQSSEGAGICHIYCSKKGDYIFAANYGSGHVTTLPVGENGVIAPASSVVIGEGTGPVESRQQGPHAHQVMLDPGQNFLLVPDLGTDKVMIYAFDPESGILTPNPAQPFFKLAPGAGPRHLAFHPDGKSLYIVNEINSTLTACSYNSADGTITEVNTLSTVEASHEGMKYPAAVRVHPNGNFLYASTRGENSCITTFRINSDRSATMIQVMEQVPNWPRDFNVDPSGRFMLVAGERSDEIRLYNIDPENGVLSETGGIVKLPAPASVLFVN